MSHPSPIRSFYTGGHTIYHLRVAATEGQSDKVLYSASYTGDVFCHTLQGDLLWTSPTGGYFAFDLEAADIDGDGWDELLVASSDGNVYAFDHTGDELWRFERDVPVYQVRAVTKGAGSPVILAGGIERRLYALEPDGSVRGSRDLDGVIRLIRIGSRGVDNGVQAFVATARSGISGPSSIHALAPRDLGSLWHVETPGRRSYFSATVLDLDNDGCDEIVLSQRARGVLDAFDHDGTEIVLQPPEGIRAIPYRMNLLSTIQIRTSGSNFEDTYLLGLFGAQIILYGLDGTVRRVLEGKYAFADGAFDVESGVYYMASAVSGGDGIHAMDLCAPDWETAFCEFRPEGKLARIESNLDTLRQQAATFERPTYQRPPKRVVSLAGTRDHEIPKVKYENIEIAQHITLCEDYDRSSLGSIWSTQQETRHTYDNSAADIIAFAHQRERDGRPFSLWAGHGFHDMFYMQFETMEGVLKAAPRTFKAFVFAELERIDEAMGYAIRERLRPLAKLCRQYGSKMLLRNKNIFWNGTCYTPLWRSFLFEEGFGDVLVPSMEETNCRTQDTSLAGRVGLWLTGAFDTISVRAVTDNAIYTRFWEWGQQQLLSLHIRAMALGTSLGAELLHINMYQGKPEDLLPFYDLLDRGALFIPDREDLLSISETCVGMRTPSPTFAQQATNGHNATHYEPNEPTMVFGRMACYWGGAPLPEGDYSRYANGVSRRMTHFIPPNPYGLIPIVPADLDLDNHPRFEHRLDTDGEKWFDSEGNPHSPTEYGDVVEQQLKRSADRLPVRVIGDVAWVVSRIDAVHVRVTLLDPGYVDPDDREANVVCQHLEAFACTDILSGEELQLSKASDTQSNRVVHLTVPMGSLRILDITHR